MGNSNTKPESLARLRERIDALDEEIMGLVFKRIELSNFIMSTKPPTEVVDQGREQAIVGHYSQKLLSVSSEAKLKRLVLAIIATSQEYPEK